MQFKIHNSYTLDFVNVAVPKIFKHYILIFNKDGRFYNIDNYLKNSLGINYKSVDILLFALNTSYISELNKYCIINIGNSDVFKDTNYTLKSLVNLIEDGNLDIKGSHVLGQAFSYLNIGIDRFWDMYCYGSL